MSNDTIAGINNQIREIDKDLQEKVLSKEQRKELKIQRQALVNLKTTMELDLSDDTITGLNN